jgi:hypothetical protein
MFITKNYNKHQMRMKKKKFSMHLKIVQLFIGILLIFMENMILLVHPKEFIV